MVDLTKDEALAIASHIDATLIDSIRDDTDIDSMQWLRNMIHGYEKLCEYSGYVGLTEEGPTQYTTLNRSKDVFDEKDPF